MVLSQEKVWLFILIFILGFLAITFNPQLAFVYGLFIVGSYFIEDSLGLRFKINGIFKNTFSSIFYGLLATVAFLFVSFIISFFLQAAQPLLQGNFISNYLKVFASETPVLAGNKFLTFATFGGIIPIIETIFFFGVTLTLVLLLTRIQFNKINFQTIIVVLLLSSAFTFFHFQVRGLADNIGLIGTFIFAIISLILIMRTRELESAVWFHVFWNSLVVYQQLFGKIEFLDF